MATTVLRFESGSYVVYRTVDIITPATGSDGVQDVDLLSLYEVDPGTAEILDELTKIGSDSWLSKGEKPRVIAERTAIDATLTNLTTRAVTLGVSSAAYTSAVANLHDYLDNHIPTWNDSTVDTQLVVHSPYSTAPATWQGFWASVYTEQTALMAALAAAQTGGGVNLVRNSSFEYDFASPAGLDGFGLYNNSPPSESATLTRENGGCVYGSYFARVAWSGYDATTTKGIYSSNGLTFHGKGCGVIGGWHAGQPYVFSVWARASDTNVGKYLLPEWNDHPTAQEVLANPPLATYWQRYVFRVQWATAPANEWFLTISTASSGDWTASNSWGQLDFDGLQIEEGLLPTAYAPTAADAQDAADAAQADATAAATLANGKNRIFYTADSTRPDSATNGEVNSVALIQGDMWLYKTTVLKADGTTTVDRFVYKTWNDTTNIWEDAPFLQQLVAGEIVAGEITADKFQANAIQTNNYQGSGSGESEYAVEGAKMRRNVTTGSGNHYPSLLVDPAGLRIGQTTFTNLWSFGNYKANGTYNNYTGSEQFWEVCSLSNTSSTCRGCIGVGSTPSRLKTSQAGNFMVAARLSASENNAGGAQFRLRVGTTSTYLESCDFYLPAGTWVSATDVQFVSLAANDELGVYWTLPGTTYGLAMRLHLSLWRVAD